MPIPNNFFSSLKEVASSPYALIGYLLLICGWIFVSFRNSRLKIIAKSIKHLPEKDRKSVLIQDYGIYLKEGMSAQEYLKGRRQMFVFILLLALIILTTVIAVTSVLNFKNFQTQSTDQEQIVNPQFCAILDTVINSIPTSFRSLRKGAPHKVGGDTVNYDSKVTIPGTRRNSIDSIPTMYFALIYNGGDKTIAYNHYVNFTRLIEKCKGDWRMFPENDDQRKNGLLEYTSFVSNDRKIIVGFHVSQDTTYTTDLLICNTAKDK